MSSIQANNEIKDVEKTVDQETNKNLDTINDQPNNENPFLDKIEINFELPFKIGQNIFFPSPGRLPKRMLGIVHAITVGYSKGYIVESKSSQMVFYVHANHAAKSIKGYSKMMMEEPDADSTHIDTTNYVEMAILYHKQQIEFMYSDREFCYVAHLWTNKTNKLKYYKVQSTPYKWTTPLRLYSIISFAVKEEGTVTRKNGVLMNYLYCGLRFKCFLFCQGSVCIDLKWCFKTDDDKAFDAVKNDPSIPEFMDVKFNLSRDKDIDMFCTSMNIREIFPPYGSWPHTKLANTCIEDGSITTPQVLAFKISEEAYMLTTDKDMDKEGDKSTFEIEPTESNAEIPNKLSDANDKENKREKCQIENIKLLHIFNAEDIDANVNNYGNEPKAKDSGTKTFAEIVDVVKNLKDQLGDEKTDSNSNYLADSQMKRGEDAYSNNHPDDHTKDGSDDYHTDAIVIQTNDKIETKYSVDESVGDERISRQFLRDEITHENPSNKKVRHLKVKRKLATGEESSDENMSAESPTKKSFQRKHVDSNKQRLKNFNTFESKYPAKYKIETNSYINSQIQKVADALAFFQMKEGNTDVYEKLSKENMSLLHPILRMHKDLNVVKFVCREDYDLKCKIVKAKLDARKFACAKTTEFKDVKLCYLCLDEETMHPTCFDKQGKMFNFHVNATHLFFRTNYTCPICNATFSELNDLSLHYISRNHECEQKVKNMDKDLIHPEYLASMTQPLKDILSTWHKRSAKKVIEEADVKYLKYQNVREGLYTLQKYFVKDAHYKLNLYEFMEDEFWTDDKVQTITTRHYDIMKSKFLQATVDSTEGVDDGSSEDDRDEKHKKNYLRILNKGKARSEGNRQQVRTKLPKHGRVTATATSVDQLVQTFEDK